jgi:hypothetical protein
MSGEGYFRGGNNSISIPGWLTQPMRPPKKIAPTHNTSQEIAMTNYCYGIFIGVNEYLKGRNPLPAVCREGRPGYVQRYDADAETAKRLKNMLAGEMHDA